MFIGEESTNADVSLPMHHHQYTHMVRVVTLKLSRQISSRGAIGFARLAAVTHANRATDKPLSQQRLRGVHAMHAGAKASGARHQVPWALGATMSETTDDGR